MSSTSLSVSDYINLPDDSKTWVIKDLLPTSGMMNLFGPPKAGKSFSALQLAYAIADPNTPDWLSFPIETHGNVLYVQLDTPRSLWKDRFLRFQSIGFTAENEKGQDALHIADREMTPYPFDIVSPDRGGIWLRDECQRLKPTVVFIDVLRELSRADENDSGQMMHVINSLVSTIAPAACVLISHSKKENQNVPAAERDNLMNDNRGSSYVAGRMDGVVKITKKTLMYQSRTCEEGRIKIKRDKDNGLWYLDKDEFDTLLEQIMRDDSLSSQKAKARQLAELTGRSFEGCRTAIRRAGGNL
jgi:RecA-family ATPase